MDQKHLYGHNALAGNLTLKENQTRDVSNAKSFFNPSQLHVIGVISNTQRFRSRYDLFWKWHRHMQDAGVTITLVEMALGDRPFMVTDENNPDHVQVRSDWELWHKENMINLGIQNALQRYPRAEYFAWIDADVSFTRADWAVETIEQLQHYQVIQMWSQAIDLNSKQQPISTHNGFVWSWFENDFQVPPPVGSQGYYGQLRSKQGFWHPGYAWAATRQAIDMLGGLIDWAILGSADHHMAMALIGEVKRTIPTDKVSKRFAKKMELWEKRATQHVKYDIGYLPCTILHAWHGKKRERFYVERWKILKDNDYDPDVDLKRDAQGLWQLTDEKWKLRNGIRRYMASRNEDSIDE